MGTNASRSVDSSGNRRAPGSSLRGYDSSFLNGSYSPGPPGANKMKSRLGSSVAFPEDTGTPEVTMTHNELPSLAETLHADQTFAPRLSEEGSVLSEDKRMSTVFEKGESCANSDSPKSSPTRSSPRFYNKGEWTPRPGHAGQVRMYNNPRVTPGTPKDVPLGCGMYRDETSWKGKDNNKKLKSRSGKWPEIPNDGASPISKEMKQMLLIPDDGEMPPENAPTPLPTDIAHQNPDCADIDNDSPASQSQDERSPLVAPSYVYSEEANTAKTSPTYFSGSPAADNQDSKSIADMHSAQKSSDSAAKTGPPNSDAPRAAMSTSTSSESKADTHTSTRPGNSTRKTGPFNPSDGESPIAANYPDGATADTHGSNNFSNRYPYGPSAPFNSSYGEGVDMTNNPHRSKADMQRASNLSYRNPYSPSVTPNLSDGQGADKTNSSYRNAADTESGNNFKAVASSSISHHAPSASATNGAFGTQAEIQHPPDPRSSPTKSFAASSNYAHGAEAPNKTTGNEPRAQDAANLPIGPEPTTYSSVLQDPDATRSLTVRESYLSFRQLEESEMEPLRGPSHKSQDSAPFELGAPHDMVLFADGYGSTSPTFRWETPPAPDNTRPTTADSRASGSPGRDTASTASPPVTHDLRSPLSASRPVAAVHAPADDATLSSANVRESVRHSQSHSVVHARNNTAARSHDTASPSYGSPHTTQRESCGSNVGRHRGASLTAGDADVGDTERFMMPMSSPTRRVSSRTSQRLDSRAQQPDSSGQRLDSCTQQHDRAGRRLDSQAQQLDLTAPNGDLLTEGAISLHSSASPSAFNGRKSRISLRQQHSEGNVRPCSPSTHYQCADAAGRASTAEHMDSNVVVMDCVHNEQEFVPMPDQGLIQYSADGSPLRPRRLTFEGSIGQCSIPGDPCRPARLTEESYASSIVVRPSPALGFHDRCFSLLCCGQRDAT